MPEPTLRSRIGKRLKKPIFEVEKEVKEEFNIKKIGSWVLFFVFLSTIILNMGIFIYVAVYDLGFVQIFNAAEIMESQGYLQNSDLNILEGFYLDSQIILQTFDIMWLLSFVTLLVIMFQLSYFSKREGFSGVLFYLLYGVMALFFILGILLQITDWWNNVFLYGVLANVAVSLPFYSWYLTNVGIVNLTIIIICIVLNFVDFDVLLHKLRKKDQIDSFEKGGDEI